MVSHTDNGAPTGEELKEKIAKLPKPRRSRKASPALNELDGSTIQSALVKAQRALGNVRKDARNAHHGYDYTSAEEMIRACREALGAAGLAATADRWTMSTEPGGMILATITCSLVHEDGAAIDSDIVWPVVPGGGRPIDKALAGALTAALSYWLRSLLLVPRSDAGADMETRNDAAASRQSRPKRRAPSPGATPAPPKPDPGGLVGPDVRMVVTATDRREAPDGRGYVVVTGKANGKAVSAFVFEGLEEAEGMDGMVSAEIEERRGSLVITSWRSEATELEPATEPEAEPASAD